MSELEDNRPRYKCECLCGKTFYACKSIFQEVEMSNLGFGSCPQCKTFYNLEVQEESKTMKLTPWDEFLKQVREENNKNNL